MPIFDGEAELRRQASGGQQELTGFSLMLSMEKLGFHQKQTKDILLFDGPFTYSDKRSEVPVDMPEAMLVGYNVDLHGSAGLRTLPRVDESGRQKLCHELINLLADSCSFCRCRLMIRHNTADLLLQFV